LSRPGAAAVCIELESAGFFFSGIEPHVKLDDYLLRLQMQRAPIGLNLIQTASDAGRELLIYVQEERERASKQSSQVPTGSATNS